MNKLKEKKLHREAIVKGEEQYTLDDYARDFREITDTMAERLEEMGKEIGGKDKIDKEVTFKSFYMQVHFGALNKSPEEVLEIIRADNPKITPDYLSFVRSTQKQFEYEIDILMGVFMRKYLDFLPDGETTKLTTELLNDYLQSFMRDNVLKK